MEAGTFDALRSSRALAIGTSVRIVASPVILGLMLGHDWTAATILFLVAAATDFLDGRLARRWKVTTKLGSFLDTTADKLLVSTALIGLVTVSRVSPWRTRVSRRRNPWASTPASAPSSTPVSSVKPPPGPVV